MEKKKEIDVIPKQILPKVDTIRFQLRKPKIVNIDAALKRIYKINN